MCEINKLILKFLWKCQGLRIAKKNLEKRTKLEDAHFLTSKFTTKLEQSECGTSVRKSYKSIDYT